MAPIFNDTPSPTADYDRYRMAMDRWITNALCSITSHLGLELSTLPQFSSNINFSYIVGG